MTKDEIRNEVGSKNKGEREKQLEGKPLRVRQDFLNIWDTVSHLIGELVISDSWTISKFLGLAQDSDDYYYVLLTPNRGIVCSSCVGGISPLKGYMIDEDYVRMESVFNLNVQYWKNNELKQGVEFSDSFGGPIYQKNDDLVLVKRITEYDLLENMFDKLEDVDPVYGINGYIRKTDIPVPSTWPSGKVREEKRYTHEYFVFDPEMQEVLYTGFESRTRWRTLESVQQLSKFIDGRLNQKPEPEI